LRVEFLLETDGGCPREAGVFLNSRWSTVGIPFALTPIDQLFQSPPSPVPGDLEDPATPDSQAKGGQSEVARWW